MTTMSSGSASSGSGNSPPYYILFTQSSSSSLSNTLGHPTIQYHYADDSPLNLLPQSPDEHVLLLDHGPSSPAQPAVASTSKSMAITSLKITEAPGAAAAEEKHNDKMYIIETTSSVDKPSRGEKQSSQMILAQFKQRNALLRRALTFNGTHHTVLSPVPHSKSQVHSASEMAINGNSIHLNLE
ncbi:hypothetical protein E1B28_001249 [Marasmius oreades]|uniref:Uncharacterized protein n=1 Tax=Marasmius oreades TaxID=181124 RepID=A0A9P7V301_9AGAR|nr:uncharacterized protein E1B28_001249 [Marasmius oreades]KAG7099396.1 hypothetical protein E1B28_001249 [Marasmius oreades]